MKRNVLLSLCAVALPLAGCGGNSSEISPIRGYDDYVVIGNDVYTVDGYQGQASVDGPYYPTNR